MSLVTVHMRWDDVTQEDYQQLQRLLTPGSDTQSDRLSHRLHRLGKAMLVTDVWQSEAGAQRVVAQLPAACETAGLPEPRVAVVVVPAMFLAGYKQRASQLPHPRPPVTGPALTPVDAAPAPSS